MCAPASHTAPRLTMDSSPHTPQLRCRQNTTAQRGSTHGVAAGSYSWRARRQTASKRVTTPECAAPGSSSPTASSTPVVGSALTAALTLPTLLTLARVVAVPVLLIGACLYGSLHPLLTVLTPTLLSPRAVHALQAPWSPWVCFILFVAARITDWLDGYLARKARPSAG